MRDTEYSWLLDLPTKLDRKICLLNAYHRYCFFDCRFAAGFNDTYIRAGGLTESRAPGADGIEPEVEATRKLRQHFGDAIRSSTYGSSTITKHGRNPGRRQIHLPFKTSWTHAATSTPATARS
jgi:hypothetical protein